MKDSGYVGGESSHRFDRSHNELKILSLNARSLLPKIESLQLLVEAEDLDVICVVETWLSAEILDAEISIQGYQCFRCERNRHGGGIVVYVRDCLSTTPIMDNVVWNFFFVPHSKQPQSECSITHQIHPRTHGCFVICMFGKLGHHLFHKLGDFNINFCNTFHRHFCKLSNLMHVLFLLLG